MNPDETPDLERYGTQPEPAPDPHVIPSGRVWAYVAIAGGLLCWPVGIVAGAVALSKGGLGNRAWWLAVTGLVFGVLGGLYTALLLMS